MEENKYLERTKKYTADSDLALYEEVSDVADSIGDIAKVIKDTFKGVEMMRVKGEKGDKGEKGATGPEGKEGKQGIQGIKGEKGDKGDKGDIGPIGPIGEQGYTGDKGDKGDKGEKGEPGKDGKDADEGRVIEEVTKRIPVITQKQGGLGPSGLWAGSANPFVVKSAGVELGRDIRSINFQGSGITSVINNNGDVTVTINSGGGAGYTKETPNGTVDGVNVTFTVTTTPVYIVSDGVTYFDSAGYTIAGLTLTLEVPPNTFIRSFY